MKRLLHIIASPREEESRTLQLSKVFLEAFQKQHPDWVIDELNLPKEDLPPLNRKYLKGKYVLLAGQELSGEIKETWREILQHIDRFKTADLFLVSSPMWNFGVPYTLKHYIDLIIQPGYLFRFTQTGQIEGLVKNKKMYVVSTRGGDYSGQMKDFDLQEPYLRTIFGFIGITDITFIKAQPMDMGLELQKQKLTEAKKVASDLGARA